MSNVRGSLWRKWDLHIHTPTTKLNNQYQKKCGNPDLDRFCHILNQSDVHAFGLTDYFSLDGYFTLVDHYRKMERNGELENRRDVLFLPNLELRLPNTVNKNAELIDYHIIFNPTLTLDVANRFLSSLKTSILDAQDRALPCNELTAEHYEQATVDLESINQAVTDTFGKNADRQNHLVTIVPVNGNGIRTDSGNQRKRRWSDNVERSADGLFGNKNSVEHFLKENRYDSGIASAPKPVFAGSDAHSFSDLENWLGQEVSGDGNDKNIAWIKADLTWEGFRQAFVEPAGRVRMQRNIPEFKEPRKVISSVRFSKTEHFPEIINLNPGLNSIIGSRSSGKSSLLAHIAHAVSPEYTEAQQISAGNDPKNLGPAPGHRWSSVGELECKVVWGDANATSGKVIYVPQNSLFSISARPEEIADKIRPVIRRVSPELDDLLSSLNQEIDLINHDLKEQVGSWFRIRKMGDSANAILSGLGDRKSIERSLAELSNEVSNLRSSCQLTDKEIESYEDSISTLNHLDDEKNAVHLELSALSEFIGLDSDSESSQNPPFSLNFSTTPGLENLSADTRNEAQRIIDSSTNALHRNLANLFASKRSGLLSRGKSVEKMTAQVKSTNSDIIERYEKLDELKEPETRIEALRAELAEFDQHTSKVEDLNKRAQATSEKILNLVKKRNYILSEFISRFNSANASWDEISFGADIGFDESRVSNISSQFNKRSESRFIDRGADLIKIDMVRDNPEIFLAAIATGQQRLNKGADAEETSSAVLSLTEEIRFTAELDGDKIGGFESSSMTPGKQALFALRLILGESDEPWPLLLDQPEDDLDSRSIFDVIVADLIDKKSDRQIIIVTHDANLVVGADSEAVIVANRHGADRPNQDSRTFDYLTGSLENSLQNPCHPATLGRLGIREHACEILDGGERAFQKRRDKYRI